MKLFKNIQNRARRGNIRGFTLAEMVITVGVFLFIFTGVMVAVQVFGLRIYTLAATKLSATAGGREALNQIRDQIREGRTVNVGSCSSAVNSSFHLITNASQQGNALFDAPPRHYKMRIADETGEKIAYVDIPLTFVSDIPDVPQVGGKERKK